MTKLETFNRNENSNYIYDLNYKFYNFSGFGFLENPTPVQKKLYSIYHVIVHIIYIFFIFGYPYDAYLVRNDKEKLFLNLCVTFTAWVSLLKIWALKSNMKNFTRIRRNFKCDFNLDYVSRNKEAQKLKDERAELVKKFTKLFYSMGFSVVGIWLTFPLLDPKTAKEKRFALPFPLVQDRSSPGFEIIYTFQAFVLAHFVSNVISNDLILSGFLMRLCDHFDILKFNLKEIKNLYARVGFQKFVIGYENVKTTSFLDDSDWKKEETTRLMRQNIVYHKKILNQFQLIREVYGMQLFFQITIGAMIISVVAYDVILQSRKFNAPLIQQLLYVGGVTMDIFLMCYLGTQIQTKSEEVVETLYDLPWYELDKDNQKTLMFMIAKCRRPPVLTARYLFHVNLETFQSLMQTSYNVMALLNETR